MYLWKKKVGDVHIANKGKTFCGRPMLGNNYADQKTLTVTCEKCLEEYSKKALKLRSDTKVN